MPEEAPRKVEQLANTLVQEEFDRRYLLLIAVPLSVYLLFYSVIAETRNAGIAFEVIPVDQFATIAAAEAKYRYLWISAFLVSGAVSLTVIASCAMSLYRNTLPRHRPLIIWLVVFFVTAIAIFETFPDFFDIKRWYEYMGDSLYQSTLGKMPVTMDASNNPVQHEGASILHKLNIGLNFVKVFGGTALIIIGVGAILTLSHITAKKGSDPAAFTEQKAKHLARNILFLKAYLYQSSAVYVFAVIAMISYMFWPIPFLDGADAQTAYRELLVGSAILQGVGYTLGTASLYLPAAMLLRQRISRLAKYELVTDEGTSAEEWLRERGLHFQPLEDLRQATLVLLPAVVSAVPALINI